jgi:uncharacterized protein (DUF305 family)
MAPAGNLNSLAISATNHCLTGCLIGEVTGMAIGTGAGWGDVATMSLAIGLAYLFGFGLTSMPLFRANLAIGVIVTTALATDTISITIMEAVDNLFIVVIPGALEAGLGDALFWLTLFGGFAVAYPFAWYANRYLLARGQGHAYVHAYHGHGDEHGGEPPEPPGVQWGVVAGALLTAGALIGIVAVISSNREHDGSDEEHTMSASAAQVDDAFATQMIDHHQLAIEMAEVAKQRAEHPELRNLAAGIVTTQANEVAELRAINERLAGGGTDGQGEEVLGLSHAEMGMDMDPAELQTADPFDRAFIDAMIPHHRGAIAMARIELEEGEDHHLKEIAQSIITAQTSEIAQMGQWRRQWYGVAAAPPPDEGMTGSAPAHEGGH